MGDRVRFFKSKFETQYILNGHSNHHHFADSWSWDINHPCRSAHTKRAKRMNCEKYMALDDLDKSHYLASLIHACQSDNELFEKGMKMIEEGKDKGIFDRVKIGHQINSNGEDTSTPNS